MSRKKSAPIVLVTIVCFLAILPNTALGMFSVTCESEFVPIGESFCPGVPVLCTVLLSTSSCSQNGNMNSVEVGRSNLTVLILDGSTNYTITDFDADQTDFMLEIATVFLPSGFSTELTVQISSSNSQCEFNISTTDDISETGDCLYPLTLNLEIINISSAEPLKGGSEIALTLEVNTLSSGIISLVLALGPSNPALNVISYSPNDDPSLIVTPYSAALSTHTIPMDSDPFLVVSELLPRSTFLVNVTLQVSNFVLPKSILYFSFHAYYHHPDYDHLTIQLSSPQIRDFVAASPSIGDWSFRLPFYNRIDRKRNTFPPNEGDNFVIRIPVILPCVSTELNISVRFPEFHHRVARFFYTEVTDVSVSTPSNLISIPQLCESQRSCTVDGGIAPSPVVVQTDAAGPHTDIIVLDFGALVYNLTSEGCVDDSNCLSSCYEEEITLTFSGHVVSEVDCEEQTLADNVTVEMRYIAESTFSPGSDIIDVTDTMLFPVNASMPAIDLPISSHLGVAGDSFNITFEVLHDIHYSSFSAYDLNYTFSVDPHLDPSDNVTICFFNSTTSDPVSCESEPFENYTISRLGYHEVFTLDVHRVELTLEVTVIQEVAPGVSYLNPGDAVFQSLPNNNTLDLAPVVCYNTSCGAVDIHPVAVQPWVVHWSDVDATNTEMSPHYITIDEQFNMTSLVCLPQSLTGIEHITLVPSSGNSPLVTVNDAFVVWIGSKVLNSTLSMGENIFTSENISLNDINTTVTFFFGNEVLIPSGNDSEDTERCFEIGLHCTVDNIASLVDGSRITYTGYVETDFNIRSNLQSITLIIAEPTLITVPIPFTTSFDAGDVLSLVTRVQHSTFSLNTNAFRLNLTVTYPTDYFFLNSSDSDSTMLLLDSTTRLYSINTDSEGEIIFSADELEPGHTLEARAYFKLTNNVEPASVYTIPHLLEWHNLPFEVANTGREYSTTGDHTITIKAAQLSIVYTTSNSRTPNENVQIGEYVYMNVTVVLPEGFSSLSVQVSQINIQPDHYTLNITYGEVLHIGDSLSNVSLVVGDMIDSSPNIYQSGYTDVNFIFGTAVSNSYDNVLDEGDKVVVYIEAYISDYNGTSVANQDIPIEGVVIEEPLARDRVDLLLSHPQIQVSTVFVTPFGPWDGGDVLDVIIVIQTRHSGGFVAYDTLLVLETDKGDMPHNFTLLNTSQIVGVLGCSDDDDVIFTQLSPQEIMLSLFTVKCFAIVWLQVQILDDAVISSDTFTITATIKEYYSLSPSASELGLRYGPEDPRAFTGTFKGSQLTLTTNVSSPALFVASEDTLQFESTLTIAEGHTLNVSVEHYITVLHPADPSAVNLDINLQSIEIYPLSESMVLPNLGDMFNPSDNLLDINDTSIFTYTASVPVNSSGTSFSFTAETNYTTSQTQVEVQESITIYVITPDIDAITTLSNRIVYTGVTIKFMIVISRTDEMFPDYDIYTNLTIALPPTNLLNISSGDLLIDPTSDGLIALYTFRPLSYVSSADIQVFQFEGTIGSNVSNGQILDLFSISLDYTSEPTNGREYREIFTVPTVFIVEPTIVSLEIDLVHYDRDTDVGSLRLTLGEIAGPPDELLLMIELNPAVVEFVVVEVTSIGSGLVYDGTSLIDAEISQRNVSISNLTLNITNENICMECDRDVIVVTNVIFLTRVTDCSNLLNASVFYSSVQKSMFLKCTTLWTSVSTSNPDTLGNTLQVSEELLVNITLVPQEDVVTHLSVVLLTNQTSPMDYPLIVRGVQVIHVGSSLRNVSVEPGDSDMTTYNINITSLNQVDFEFGDVFNMADNSEDEVTIQLEFYVSAVGTGVETQDLTVTYFLENEGFLEDVIPFQLVHPQVQMTFENISTISWDSNDTIDFVLSLSSVVVNATAYDLSFNVSLESGLLSNLDLSSSTTSGGECMVSSIMCSDSGLQMTCSSLPQSCTAHLALSVTLPLTIIIGSNITISVVLAEYDSSPGLVPLEETVYMPVIASITEDSRMVSTAVILSTNFPTQLEIITLTASLCLPEGITPNLSVVFDVVWNTTESLSLNLSLQSVRFGSSLNLTDEDFLLSYSMFHFGDVLNMADNILTPYGDIINITLQGQVPLESFRSEFTVSATTSYGTSERITIENSTVGTVIGGPLLLYTTTVSSRLVSVGETVVYNLTLVYVPTELSPNTSAVTNISLVFPSFVDVNNDNLNVYQELTQQDVYNTGDSYTLIELMQENLNNSVSVLEVVFPVLIRSRNESNILSMASLEYSFTEFILLRKFSESISFPTLFLPQLNFDFYLYSSSDSRTEGALLTYREIGVWRAELTNVIGPATNLVLRVNSEYEELYAVDVNIISVGTSLTYDGSPNLFISNQHVTVTFENLTLVDPDMLDCNLIVDVHYMLAAVVNVNRVVTLQSNVTYGSFQTQSEAVIVLTPPTDLALVVEGPMEMLEAGSVYSLNVTIQHNSSESLDAYDIVVGIDEPLHISFHNDFHYLETEESWTNGTLLTSNVSILLGSGLSFPMLRTNNTIHLYVTFSVNSRTRLNSTVLIPIYLEYFNSGGTSGNFSDSLNKTIIFQTSHFPPAFTQIAATSSQYTMNGDFAINEVIKLEIRSTMPHGVVDLEYHTVVKSPMDTQLPVEILDTVQILPVDFELENPNVTSNSMDLYIPLQSELHLIWSIGTIYNRPDGVTNVDDVIVLEYTLAISLTNLSNIPLQIQPFAITDNSSVLFTKISGAIVEPVLTVVKNTRILVLNSEQVVEFTTTLCHENDSTAAAFNVLLEEFIPVGLNVQQPINVSLTSTGSNMTAVAVESEMVETNNGTSIRVSSPVFTTDSEIVLIYTTQVNSFFPNGQNITAPVMVNYSSIKQEGIGASYSNLEGKMYSVCTLSCIIKETVPFFLNADNFWVIFLCIFFGITTGCGISVLVLLLRCYWRTKQTNLKIVPALVAATVFRAENNDGHHLFGKKKLRPLVSSLLVALQEPQWYARVDVYEFSEAEYISEVEGDLFELEMEITRLLTTYMLDMLPLNNERLLSLRAKCTHKISELKANLKESISDDIQDVQMKFVADKLLEEEDLKLAQDMEVEEIRNYSDEVFVLEVMNEQNQKQIKWMLSSADIRRREREQQILYHYMLHYSLGLKVLGASTLKHASGSSKQVDILLDKLKEVSELILAEKNEIKERSIVRRKRQQLVLLEKRILDEEHLKWKTFMVKQMSEYIKGTHSEEKRSEVMKIRAEFVSKLDGLQSTLMQKELSIVRTALEKLKVLEQQLGTPLHTLSENMTSVETAVQNWYELQTKREEALETLEQRVASQLNECWKVHLRNRTRLLDNQTSNFSLFLTSKGVKLQQCNKIMQQHALSRVELHESLETSKLIKKAKFQAMLNNQSEHLLSKKLLNEKLLSMKHEIEMTFVREVMSSFSMEEMFEEYHRRVIKYQNSIALDQWSIIVKTARRHQQKAKRKLEANQQKYFRQLQQKMRSSSKDSEMVCEYLDKREEIILESCSTIADDERRRADKELLMEKEQSLYLKTTTSDLEEIEEDTWVTPPPAVQPGLIDQTNINDETQKLLSSYQEDVLKIEAHLDEDQRRSASELDRKRKERQMQRGKLRSGVANSFEPANLIPGIKHSKLRELVIRQRCAAKLELKRKEHMTELRTALEELRADYYSKRQEAITNLEQKFEKYISKVGMLSENQLIDIFDQWHQPTRTNIKRRSSATLTRPSLQSEDPLLMNRMKNDGLPPLMASRRGTII